ncbi:Putative Autophagy-related protein Atg29 (Eurofung) [Aspergillus calidoustus]|uniref:Autophagy-related protein 29 n=1 Tax=Aspergillus calidoustus TaxID=454130 RepID=A0A0U5CC38_ASPCI|nr:Putative Autophagy-related protein Atg29 (Eurofung) [Aspergillus calidoustus]
MPSPTQVGNTKFTVLIRLPFPRGDFVDPPPVEWNAAKDQALWDILSRPSKGNDIDWKALYGTSSSCPSKILTPFSAESFDVTLQFLLQQAAWLYHRQLSQVRAQMLRVGTTHSSTASPVPGSIYASTALGQPTRAGQGSGIRAPVRLVSQSKDTPPLRAPMPRRTSSGTTVQQIKGPRVPSQPVTPTLETKEPRWESHHDRRPSTSRREQAPAAATLSKSPTLEEEDFISSSSESNSDPEIDASSRRKGFGFKRFGRFSTHRPGLREDDNDDDDESPAFLPLSRGLVSASRGASGHDLSATLRMEQEGIAASQRQVTEPAQGLRKSMTTESSGSSVSSGVPVSHSNTQLRRQMNHPSPRRTAELAHMSPRRSTTSGRDISDGTPSMGSSFSDLDDTSVTESMLQDALLNNMQHGGMASRMSTISQALRSRYLP